nr:Uma2 family endonuclease [Anaerolineae bacterium]
MEVCYAIRGRLYRALHAHVVERGLGVVQFAPLPVRLWPGKIREPDILFVSHEHADRIGEQFYGPPDLVIEVLSAGTWRTDRLEKMVEYAQAGVVEYWIVDPEAKTIEVFVLREGAYTLLDRWGTGEIVRSALLEGLEIAVNELFDRERM